MDTNELVENEHSSTRVSRIFYFKARKTVFAVSLSVLMLLSPVLTHTASASWWKLARDLLLGVGSSFLYDAIKNPADAGVSNSKITYSQAITTQLDRGIVDYYSDNFQVSGKVARIWNQQRGKAKDSGIGGQILWDDGVVSRILFLNDSRVRIWVEGKEYGGKWGWKNGTLYAQADAGGFYRFR